MSLLELAGAPFATDFDRRPFTIRHHLVGHPLFTLERLVALAATYDDEVLYFRADHEINQVDEDPAGESRHTFADRGLARPQLSVAETITQIEAANAWMQLRHVGRDPEYRQLLDELIDEFRRGSEPVAPGTSEPRADIFISSPGATTPFHLDEEHNFLLQIRGSKRLAIADGADRRVLDAPSLERFFDGNGELARYAPHLEQHSVHVDLGPGEGVHIPACHPHWVQNGPEVSISLGVLWYSDVTARRSQLYRTNRWMAKAHLRPKAVGQRPRVDALKGLPAVVKRRTQRAVRAVTSR